MPTNNVPRPQLDPMTYWRAEQVARAERRRSVADAIRVMVEESWERRQAAALAKAAPAMRADAAA